MYKGFDIETFFDEDKAKALIDYLELDSEYNNIEEAEYDEALFSVDGDEYLVLTDDEADERARDYLTSDDNYLWKEAVGNDRTLSGLDDWVEEVLNIDGRSFLASYDGEQREQKVDDVWYFIYRVN